jgi:excinuclease UvrABC nuclease subunit
MVGSKCALYRHFDVKGTLLYVGISLRPFSRFKEHNTHSGWADQIANMTIEHFPTRMEAMAAEIKAVQEENPLYNIKLRKPKKEPRLAKITKERAEQERTTLTSRVLHFNPLYKPNEAASALGIPTSILNREIEAGNLAVVLIPSPKAGKLNKYITGWHLIDWLESRELQAIEGASYGG